LTTKTYSWRSTNCGGDYGGQQKPKSGYWAITDRQAFWLPAAAPVHALLKSFGIDGQQLRSSEQQVESARHEPGCRHEPPSPEPLPVPGLLCDAEVAPDPEALPALDVAADPDVPPLPELPAVSASWSRPPVSVDEASPAWSLASPDATAVLPPQAARQRNARSAVLFMFIVLPDVPRVGRSSHGARWACVDVVCHGASASGL
jgi:hypothetical protein